MRFWPALLLVCLPLATSANAQDDFLPREIPIAEATDPQVDARWQPIDKLQQKVWQTKVTFQCKNLPLGQAAEQLAKQTGLSFRVDSGFLVRKSTPVTVDVTNVSLHSTLVMMLRPCGYLYQVEPDEIVITTPIFSRHRPPVRYYETSEILPETPNLDPNNWDVLGPFRSLIDEDVRLGGLEPSGKFESYRQGIIAEVPPRIHWETRHLIERVKKAQSLPSDAYPTAALMVPPAVADATEIARQLRRKRITWSSENATLEELTKALQQAVDVPVCIDTDSIRKTDLGKGKRPIIVAWQDRTVEQALDELATQYAAGWRIVDDRIELTAKSESYRAPVLKIYPVRDLVWYGLELPAGVKSRLLPLDPGRMTFGGGSGVPPPNPFFDPSLPALPDYQELVEAIEAVLPSWRDGTIVHEFVQADCLLIATTPQKHEQIADLLQQLRRQQHVMDPEKFLAYLDKVDQEVITVFLFADPKEITREELQKLANRVQQEVEPESWKGEDSSIVVTSEKLILRHQRKILRQTIPILDEAKGLRFWYWTWDRHVW